MLIFDNNAPIKQKQWINTKVEFEWSKELQKYVEISAEGYWYDGEMAMAYDQDGTYTFEGNVGIGTESPDHELSVIGDIRVGGWTTTDDRKIGKPNGDWAGGSAYLRFVDSDAGTDGDSRKGTAIDIYTHEYNGGTNHCATFDANCNVGIGTTSPGALLDISGIRENQIRLTSYDISANVDETIGGVEFYSSDSGNEGVKASISAIAANTEGSAYMTFSTGVDTERMRIDSTGNVGIGTTSSFGGSATSKYLSVLNTDTTDSADRPAVLELACSNKGDGVRVGTIDFWQDVDGGDDMVASIIGVQQGTTSNNVGGRLRFQTKADNGSIADRMNILQNGNVGIGGITAPNAKLHLADSSGTNAWGSSANPAFQIGESSYYRFGTWTTSEGAYLHNKNGNDGLIMVTRGVQAMVIDDNQDIMNGAKSATWHGASDIKMKKDVEAVTDALDKVKNLRGVSFLWDENYRTNKPNGKREYGFIAQEVQEVIPDLVHVHREGHDENWINNLGDEEMEPNEELLGVDDRNGFEAIMIEAIKELSAKVDALENK